MFMSMHDTKAARNMMEALEQGRLLSELTNTAPVIIAGLCVAVDVW